MTEINTIKKNMEASLLIQFIYVILVVIFDCTLFIVYIKSITLTMHNIDIILDIDLLIGMHLLTTLLIPIWILIKMRKRSKSNNPVSFLGLGIAGFILSFVFQFSFPIYASYVFIFLVFGCITLILIILFSFIEGRIHHALRIHSSEPEKPINPSLLKVHQIAANMIFVLVVIIILTAVILGGYLFHVIDYLQAYPDFYYGDAVVRYISSLLLIVLTTIQLLELTQLRTVDVNLFLYSPKSINFYAFMIILVAMWNAFFLPVYLYVSLSSPMQWIYYVFISVILPAVTIILSILYQILGNDLQNHISFMKLNQQLNVRDTEKKRSIKILLVIHLVSYVILTGIFIAHTITYWSFVVESSSFRYRFLAL